MREVCGRVLELIAEDLGVDRSLMRAMVVGREGSDELVRVNHYPPCPLLPPVDCGVTGSGSTRTRRSSPCSGPTARRACRSSSGTAGGSPCPPPRNPSSSTHGMVGREMCEMTIMPLDE